LGNLKKIRNLFKDVSYSSESLYSRTIKGGLWVFSLRIADRIFQLLRTIILARILSPNDFGLFGIALLVLSILQNFTESGFQHALIQKRGETKSYLDTAWTIGLIRGFSISIIVFFLAKPASIFFATPDAESILRVIGVSIILYSLTNITALYFQKELKFQKYFKYQFSGTIADVIVSITSAILLKSVWALVLGLLAGNLIRCIMSYIIEPYKPSIKFNVKQAKELFYFGKWVLASNVLIFLITHGDDIFIGKLLGATMLGFYQMAYRISNLPATEITHVISQVSFPAYAKLQDNISKLREGYLRVLQFTTFITFPIAALIFVLAPEFTKIFLGEKWMPISTVMQVLVLGGLIRSLAATTGPIFLSTGKPKIDTRWQIIRLLVLVILIYPLTIRYGILGTSIAVFISIFISCIGFCIEAIKVTKCRIKNFIKLTSLPLVNAIIIVVLIYVLKFYINANTFIGFFSLVFIGILISFGVNYLFDKCFNYGIKLLIKKSIISYKNTK
jgi:lipopolysaccharide exporter